VDDRGVHWIDKSEAVSRAFESGENGEAEES
jgi:hypothetical protein